MGFFDTLFADVPGNPIFALLEAIFAFLVAVFGGA